MSLATPTIRTPEDWANLQCEHIGPEGLWPVELAQEQLKSFPDWQIEFDQEGRVHSLKKRFDVQDFEAVKLAVVGVSKVADEQDHHPFASFSFNFLEVTWNTHSAHGVSANDWICAAQTDAIFERIG